MMPLIRIFRVALLFICQGSFLLFSVVCLSIATAFIDYHNLLFFVKHLFQLFLIIFKKANFFYREYISFKQKAFHNFRSTIPRKNHKTGILFTISYIKNVVANEINTINKNCPATPIGNFNTKNPVTTKAGI